MGDDRTLLVEVGVEEVPSWFLEGAKGLIAGAVRARLAEARLAPAEVKVFVTPRRLAVVATGLPAGQEDERRVVTGPPAKAAVDASGGFTAAALKFAEKNGCRPDELKLVDTPKGKYVAVEVTSKGRTTAGIAGEIIPAVFNDKTLGQRKSMRWGESKGPFIRPVHWLVALLDGDVVPCALFDVAAGRSSRGHRFHHGSAPVEIGSPATWAGDLRRAFVVVDQDERREAISRGLAAEAAAAGGTLEENGELLAEVTNIVEWPVIVRGRFDPRFLELPWQVIETVMAKHQRYFAVRAKDGSGILPCFLAVANTDPPLAGAADKAAMTAGYERVLTARLEDASFFYAQDRKKPLSGMLDSLGGMVFQKGAGSYIAKAQRIQRLAESIAAQIGLDENERRACARAALFAKADLASSVVYELPELQGVMGGIYARLSGEDEAISEAIGEHYKPASAGDTIPSTTMGLVVSLADKIDTLVALFALGNKPSATSDPMGMRRLCLGIIRVILGGNIRLSLLGIAQRAAGIQLLEGIASSGSANFASFVKDRLKVFWKEKARADVVDAALECGADDVVLAAKRLDALIEFQESEEFEDLAVAFKRAYRISKEAPGSGAVRPELFRQDEERELHAALGEARPRIDRAYAAEDFTTVFSVFRSLRGPIDRYFAKVFVNAEEKEVRENRLLVMKTIADLVAGAARLDLVQFERTKLET